MARVKLGGRRQITLPADIVKRLDISAGEELEVMGSDKAIVLIPAKHIPEDQQWYYTEEWQQMMAEAFEDLRQGRMLGPFETVEKFRQAIKERTHV